VRFGSWPKASRVGFALTVCFAALSIAALMSDEIVPAIAMGAVAVTLVALAIRDCATSTGALLRVITLPPPDGQALAHASLNGDVPHAAEVEPVALVATAHQSRNGHEDNSQRPIRA